MPIASKRWDESDREYLAGSVPPAFSRCVEQQHDGVHSNTVESHPCAIPSDAICFDRGPCPLRGRQCRQPSGAVLRVDPAHGGRRVANVATRRVAQLQPQPAETAGASGSARWRWPPVRWQPAGVRRSSVRRRSRASRHPPGAQDLRRIGSPRCVFVRRGCGGGGPCTAPSAEASAECVHTSARACRHRLIMVDARGGFVRWTCGGRPRRSDPP